MRFFSVKTSNRARLLLGLALPAGLNAQPIDFAQEVQPIFEQFCVRCHGSEKPKGDFSMETRADLLKGSEYGPALVPGKPDDSTVYTTTILPPDHDDVMPPKGEKLTKAQAETLRKWIVEGARWPDGIVLKAVQRIDFVKHVQPILEANCVACHREGHEKGGLRLDSRSYAMKGSDNGSAIVPGKSSASLLYTSTILPEDHDDLMPPTNKGGPLDRETTRILRDWIDQGAAWPQGLILTPKKEELIASDGLANVAEIHQRLIASRTIDTPEEMKLYTEAIPGTKTQFAMVPIPGGQFTMGSSEDEPGHKSDESPQIKLRIEPFWMGKHEVTWSEFELFMYPEEEMKLRRLAGPQPEQDAVSDTVARPTQPYVEMSFGMGKDGYPAISMTQHAANKYCQWLSAKTGHYYRLPTEAEWEYACRAGTQTAYSFGDDISDIDDYAWYEENSDFKYQMVGKKKPNPWGLHDMHGNVAEWTLDQYSPDIYAQWDGTTSPWNRATKPYPHSVRGGSWDDTPDLLRSAARLPSHRDWKMQDPQLPKSIWYHTDAQFLGFRVIRPLKIDSPEQLQNYWTNGVERD